ncbi:hypothetical protein [Nocardia gamkensis]|uniref:Uncharacterized protein n=1 Tax=Nocardia gamkensis TaxID=352869 RepID=A0A7X6R741_9NOCA|nr:hypothetical protein [Nocardia gamkensis]NKY31061.1 hypothetical protein [Nocardia gamkensis]NQE72382.1 hypothetical protein [Nocardia gamkensis]
MRTLTSRADPDDSLTATAFDLRAGAIILAEFGAPPADPFSIRHRLADLTPLGAPVHPLPRHLHRLGILLRCCIDHMAITAEIAQIHDLIGLADELVELVDIISDSAVYTAEGVVAVADSAQRHAHAAAVRLRTRGADATVHRLLARWSAESGIDFGQREFADGLLHVIRSFERVADELASIERAP